MRLILLSGGSGKRLWPITNDSRSKQFLKVLENPNGEPESMVQRVWRQLGEVGLTRSTLIATSKAQTEMLQHQLGSDLSMLVEPERRDTFPAIALAAAYLYSVEGVPVDEVVAVLPVDSFVEDPFFLKVKELEPLVTRKDADFVLMGVNPTYPSEKFGYIVPETGFQHDGTRVKHFREKPSQAEAERLIACGALWNCGVFAFRLEKLLSLLRDKNLPLSYEELHSQYNVLPKISFDYEVLEKNHNLAMLRYDGDWKDLGTWNTLTEEMASYLMGKGVISPDCVDVHVVNELDIPVAVLGLSHIVVAASPDGLLVTDKSASPRVKEIAEFGVRPMYEERRWGWHRILDYAKCAGDQEVLTKKVCVRSGKNLSYHVHHKRSEVWTILSGEGELLIERELRRVSPGDVIQLPAGTRHSVRATTDLEFIEIQSGSELIEEDIIRISMAWEELLQQVLG